MDAEESFKGRTDKEHHTSWKSPLEDVVGFNIVDHIIIAERMHQSDLGISKKLAIGFLEHKFPKFPKWTEASSRIQ